MLTRYLGIVPWSQDFRLLVTTGGALWASIPDSRAYPVIVELRLIPDPDPSGVYFDESLQGLLR